MKKVTCLGCGNNCSAVSFEELARETDGCSAGEPMVLDDTEESSEEEESEEESDAY